MNKTRVPKGEKYWYISSCGKVEVAYETGDEVDFLRFKANNYFPASHYTPKMVEQMAKKLRAVLNGADVIEMPSEEEMKTLEERAESFWNAIRSSIYSSKDKIVDWGKRCYMAGATEQNQLDRQRLIEYLNSQKEWDAATGKTIPKFNALEIGKIVTSIYEK